MMRKSLAVCLLALASVATSAFAIEEVRVTGKVTDTVTKKPIPNAVVTVSSTEAVNFKSDFPEEGWDVRVHPPQGNDQVQVRRQRAGLHAV